MELLANPVGQGTRTAGKLAAVWSKEDQIDLPGLPVTLQNLILLFRRHISQFIGNHSRDDLELAVLGKDQKTIRIELVLETDDTNQEPADQSEVEQHPEDDLQKEG